MANNAKLTKADLVDSIAENFSLTQRDTQGLLEYFFKEIKTALSGGKSVELRGFGTFEVRLRKGRSNARNPRTGEPITVEDHGIAVFRPGKEMKEAAWGVTGG
ncbi:MAG: HU family DNA-binding protein [Spirochaetales bacterium]|jgi:integration host factor subunit beta|nr:HU family DNA-binding protein [Spirochaetales bacterium]